MPGRWEKKWRIWRKKGMKKKNEFEGQKKKEQRKLNKKKLSQTNQ